MFSLNIIKGILIIIIVFFNINCNNSNDQLQHDFSNYFSRIKSLGLQNIYKYYTFGNVRHGARIIIYPDSTQVIFLVDNKINFEIKSIKGLKDIDLVKKDLNSILNICDKFYLKGFEYNNVYNYYSIYFDLESISENTLPKYILQKSENHTDNANTGVLIYDYDNNFQKTNMYQSIKPVNLNNNWYYYATYLPDYIKE